jgi:hypothetical protein
MAARPVLFQLFDRTAVLAIGIIAGFAIGLSFNEAGRRELFGANPPGAVITIPPVGPVRKAKAADPELKAPIKPEIQARVREAGVIRVGVFGDSFGDGVWAALYHQLPAKSHFKVLRFSKEGTGFTRYRQLDLEDRARVQLADEPIDIAVICFGANDVQPIFADGHLRALLDAGWQKTIGERIDRFVARARSTGAQVYWLGLPVMRDTATDADIQAMDAFYQRRMASLGVPFIDTRAASLGPKGEYAAYLPDTRTGEPRLMRAGDGVHMTMLGYQRLTAGLAARIRAYAARLRGEQPPAPNPPLNPVVAAGPPSSPTPRPTPQPTRLPRAKDDASETARANRREEKRQEKAVMAPATRSPTPAPVDTPSPEPAHEKQ